LDYAFTLNYCGHLKNFIKGHFHVLFFFITLFLSCSLIAGSSKKQDLSPHEQITDNITIDLNNLTATNTIEAAKKRREIIDLLEKSESKFHPHQKLKKRLAIAIVLIPLAVFIFYKYQKKTNALYNNLIDEMQEKLKETQNCADTHERIAKTFRNNQRILEQEVERLKKIIEILRQKLNIA